MNQATDVPTSLARTKDVTLWPGEAEFRDLVENALVGLHVLAPDGTILWANQAELDLLGYTAAEYIGRSIAEFHRDQRLAALVLERLRRGEIVREVEARLRGKDDSTKHVLVSASPCLRDGRLVHARCFTCDITLRGATESALRASQRQLELVTDALPVLVAYVDSEQRYRFASAGYERWFGYTKAEVLGKRLWDVLGLEAYAKIRRYVERALAGETVSFEMELPYARGGTRFVEARYAPRPSLDGSPDGFVALVSDVTERKSLEHYKARSVARVERLGTITSAIADAVSPEQVYEALVDRIYDAMDAKSAALWVLDERANVMTLVRAKGYPRAAEQRFGALPLDTQPSVPAVDAVLRGEAIWLDSQTELLERYPHLRDVIATEPAYRIVCLPLLAPGRALGTLALTIPSEYETEAEERDFLLLVARYATQALERLRLFEAERRSRAEAAAAANRLAILSRASRAFVEADLDLDGRLRGIVRELGKELSSAIGISLLQSGALRMRAVYHPNPEAEALLKELGEAAPVALGQGITGAVATTGEAVVLPSVRSEALRDRVAPAYRSFLERYPISAVLCAPLRCRGEIIGTVVAARVGTGQTYELPDVALFEQLAARAASAIENGLLYQDALEARTRAEQLYRFAQAAVAAENLTTVYEAALAAIEAALATERAAILTFDSQKVMRFVAHRNLSEEYRAAVEGHSPWPPDAIAPEPVLVPDASNDPNLAAYAPLFRQEGVGALAFIPLITRGQLLGKFMLYYEEPHTFAPHEVETAIAIANHLASVIARFSAVSHLQETLRANELFAGVLAHDLKNPLSAVTTAAQLLLMRQEGSADADTTGRPLGKILSAGQRMGRMIEQLLDFTRARSGVGIPLQPRDIDLAELCTLAIDEIELTYPTWSIRQEFAGNLRGFWDSDRLLQVISNLICNAGEHGDASGIVVRLDGSSERHVTLEVQNGGTIPESLLPNLFDPFRTTRHAGVRSRGLGLGLFIVREIVRAHAGSVEVASSEAAGTTFTVVLPRAPRHS